MTIKHMVAAAILAAGTAAAFAAPAAADEVQDQQLVTAVAQYGVPVGTDEETIKLAQKTCAKMGKGDEEGIAKALEYVKKESGLADDQAVTTFAGIAAQVYCPDKLPD